MMEKDTTANPFYHAEEELQVQHIPSYHVAFTDIEFLLREETRPIRLQLEYLKPEILQREQHIESTIVIFGSARIDSPEIANEKLRQAMAALEKLPNDPTYKAALKVAEHGVRKSVYYQEARKLAYIVSNSSQAESACNFVIITGGGPGIMEAANRGAYEAKGKSIGLNILLPHEQGPNPYITPELNFQFHYFGLRKMHFLLRARAAVFFPGGYGSMDELFETLTLMQTKKISKMPILLFSKSYWTKIINFDALLEEGAIDADDLNIFSFVESAEEAWQLISDFYRVI